MTLTLILTTAVGVVSGIAAWREGRNFTAALIVAGLTSAAAFTMISVAEWLIS